MSDTQPGVALLRWPEGAEGLQKALGDTFEKMGHKVSYVDSLVALQKDIEIVFIYGPYGKFLGKLEALRAERGSSSPVVVCWNTEGLPDLRVPTALVGIVARLRSWIGQTVETDAWLVRVPILAQLFRIVDARMFRMRYLGDYLYAKKHGLMDVYADISAVYMQHYAPLGLSGTVAPFGSYFGWYKDLNLDRDIDVIWLGKRATRRRSNIIERLRKELGERGIHFMVIDGEEHPFVFDDERTLLLNRSKITLNLLRTWYDEHTLRFCIVMPNRTLVVSEPILPHVPDYEAGKHYVSVSVEEMADKIQFYLDNEDERQRIVDAAYELITKEVTTERSIDRVLEAAQPFLNGNRA